MALAQSLGEKDRVLTALDTAAKEPALSVLNADRPDLDLVTIVFQDDAVDLGAHLSLVGFTEVEVHLGSPAARPEQAANDCLLLSSSVSQHLVDESDCAIEDRLRRVLVAPVAHPQIHPGGVNLCDLLLKVTGMHGVEARHKSQQPFLVHLVFADIDASRCIYHSVFAWGSVTKGSDILAAGVLA
jgi:hypothetical protein